MPSRWTERRQRFRAILEGGACVHPASVHDPISARIAADLGFETGMFAGSVASLAVLGAPDLIVLTLSEFADQAYRIGRAAELPLMVDADHGYGNALNVMRTVEELETAGVAGLSIEDTLLPRSFGPSDKAQLLSIEEGAGKMKAALAGRRDPDLVIAGRTSAIGISGLADTIARAKAYAATGVDAMFLVGVKTREELEAVAAEIKIPAHSRRRAGRPHGSGLPRIERRAHLLAGASAVPGGGAGDPRHAEGAAGWDGTEGSDQSRIGGDDGAADARRRLRTLDAGVSGRKDLAVITDLVPGIQQLTNARASYPMDPGNKCRDNSSFRSSGCTRPPRRTCRDGRRCRRRWRACWLPIQGSPPRSPTRACWRRRARGPRCRPPA